jgi:O-antigen/teichoic acid export membrane protein
MGIVQKDSIKITAVSYFGAGIGLVNKMFLFPQFLTTEQVGLANILVSIAVLYASLSLLGTPTILLRYLPKWKDNPAQIGRFMWWMTLMATTGFLTFTLLLFAFQEPLMVYYGQKSPLLVDYFHYLIPFGAVTLYFFFFDNYLRALFKTVVPVFLFEVVLRLFVSATIFAYVLLDWRFDEFVLAYLVAHCVPTLLLLVYAAWLKKLHIRPGAMGLLKDERRQMREYGAYTLVNNTGLVMLSTIDSVLVAGALGMDKTGIYTTMFFFVSLLMIPYRAIAKIAGPVVAENWARNDMVGMDKLYKQVTASNIVIGTTMFCLLWVNLDVAFMVMPEPYAAGRYALFFLALGRLFDMFTGVNGTILVTSPKYKVEVLFSVVLIVLLMLFIPLFISLFDMEGAAIGTSLAILIYNSCRLVYLYSTYGLQPFQWKPLFFLLVGIALIATDFMLPAAWDGLGVAAIKTMVVVLVLGGAMWVFRPSEEIARMVARLSGKITK